MAPRRPSRAWAVLVTAALAAAPTAACTTPVPTARGNEDYDRKAAHTADDVHSAIATVQVALRAADDDRLFPTSLDVLVTEAEGDAGGAAETFRAVQPPNGEHAATTRDRLTTLLDDATDHLEAVRIAVRHHDDEARRAQRAALDRLADDLDAFSEDVG